MRKILIICFENPNSSPRVDRHIAILRERFAVTVVGTHPPDAPGVEFVPIERRSRPMPRKLLALAQLKLGAYEQFYWSAAHVRSALHQLADSRFDLIIAHNFEALPLALALARGAKVMLDAHEYAPREFEDRWQWRFLYQDFRRHLCTRYMSRADAVTTVCGAIASEYDARFGTRSVVVNNAGSYHELSPSSTRPDRIRMIHHGAAFPSRRLESMIELMRMLDERFRLDLMLVPGDARYRRRLEAMARRDPRIRFIPPVPMRNIVSFTHRYDIGLFLLPPTNFNYRFALPNKLFEFIQARLAVAIGPSPEMARVVNEWDCGVVARDFSVDAMATCLAGLDAAELARYKSNADRAARALHVGVAAPVVLGLVEDLLRDNAAEMPPMQLAREAGAP